MATRGPARPPGRPSSSRRSSRTSPGARSYKTTLVMSLVDACRMGRHGPGGLHLVHLLVGRLHREASAIGEDLLDLEKVVQPVVAELSPHATLLVPAPDALHGLGVVIPDPDGPGANPAGHPHGARGVGAPDPGH